MKPHPNHPPPPITRKLPDFHNLGVLLRVLLLVKLLAVATMLVREADVHAVPAALLVMASVIELPLFLAVLLLYLLQPVLKRLSYPGGVGAVLGVVAVVTVAVFMLLGADRAATLVRWLLWAVVAAAVCLVYFDYRSQRFSPALTEARLLALTAPMCRSVTPPPAQHPL